MIKRLDHDVATRIAAGEVIERPASVAKELMENSLDAGARRISMDVQQGGKVSFIITDDGCGIAFDELPLALERYATSKISSIDDLERISTLGYRGEALASVAAVSRMEIRSRTRDAGMGGVIRCEGGSVTLHAEIPCERGTRIQVDDLFFNLPARRKFMKTSSAELRRILQIVNDYSLIHPEVSFKVISDGRTILDNAVAASIEEALARRWGGEVRIISSGSRVGSVRIRMWWNPMADSRRVVTTLFVNGRRVQDAAVRAAICSGDASANGEWLVMADLPPEDVDVNIHPQKEEVRFRRSQEIFKAVYDTARNIFAARYSQKSAGEIPCAPDLTSGEIPSNIPNVVNVPERDRMFSQTPWRPAFSTQSRTSSPASDETIFTPAQHRPDVPVEDNQKRCIGQTQRGFLLFDFPDGLAIMDPHAAHERIRYEEICASFKDKTTVQKLVAPVEIPQALLPEVELSSEELKKMGFLTEGGMLTGVPALRGHGRLSAIEMLRSALRGIQVELDPAKRDREVWWRLARLACRDAVKLGRRFEPEEARALLIELEKCSTPFTCPHGRPTIIIFSDKKLEEMFER